jgi:hypothetical protein
MLRILFVALGVVLLGTTGALAGQRGTPGGPHSHAPGSGSHFVDANGDGICDLYQANRGQRRGPGVGPHDGTGHRGLGPHDGTGHRGLGPGDGSGFGAGRGNGAGLCNGTAQGQGPATGRHRGGRR